MFVGVQKNIFRRLIFCVEDVVLDSNCLWEHENQCECSHKSQT
ncbi:Uncharacterised protein [uncultured archaeon]|nr:Uncharacterised protein [uncultured archaeon]